ncbi:MAG: hypothetical protein R6W66_00245 [Pelovirga sp.]
MKRTKAVSLPLVLLLVVVLFLSLFLFSCGGGGGGGSKDIAATAYTGERSLAYLDADNAEALILGAYGGFEYDAIIPLSLEAPAAGGTGINDPYHLATLVEQVVRLAQPDTRVIPLDLLGPGELCSNYPAGYTTDTLTETDSGVQGDIRFYNCDVGDGFDVIIFDGKMSLSVDYDGDLLKLSMTVNPLYMDDGVDRYGLYGKLSATVHEYDMTSDITINMTLEEPSGKTYWLNNYKINSAETSVTVEPIGTYWGTQSTVSGRYYSNDHGYVDFVTEEVIFVPFDELAPVYDGLITFTGSDGSHANLWLGVNRDDYCINVFNAAGVVNIGTCAPR